MKQAGKVNSNVSSASEVSCGELTWNFIKDITTMHMA